MIIPKKKSTVIQDVIKAAEAGHLVPSQHALAQMKDRDIDLSDIEEMIYTATREDIKDEIRNDNKDWKYAIRGKNNNGDKDIRIVVVYVDEPKILIVTAIDKNK